MSDEINKPARGRPRAFDEQAVVAHAAVVFLDRGFEAVSYELLAREVGLSKPSLYNTFGDKGALFERVLDNYTGQALALAKAAFEGEKTLQKGVRAFLHGAAESYSKQGALSQGCLLIGTALPACAHTGQIRHILTSFIASLDSALEEIVITRYRADAEKLEHPPRVLATLLSSLLFSLAIRARTGMSQRDLFATADELAETFPRPPEI